MSDALEMNTHGVAHKCHMCFHYDTIHPARLYNALPFILKPSDLQEVIINSNKLTTPESAPRCGKFLLDFWGNP